MLFSIIIPVFNLEGYINDCLNSIFAQDLDALDYEVITIDDGSTDRSPEILEEFQSRHANVRLISDTHSGVSASRNKGLALAKGEYVLFVDGDDQLMPAAIPDVVKELRKRRPEFLIMNSIMLSERRSYSKYPINDELSSRSWTGYELASRYSRGSVASIAFNRTFLVENNLTFNEELINGEDSLFFTESSLHAKNIRLKPIDFYMVTQRAGSASRAFTYERLLKFCQTLEYIKVRQAKGNYDYKQLAIYNMLAFRIISGAMKILQQDRSLGGPARLRKAIRRLGILPITLKGIKKFRHNIILLNVSCWLYYYLSLIRPTLRKIPSLLMNMFKYQV